MSDMTAVATEIARLISLGFDEKHLLAVVAQKFPELTEQEFYAALQEATAQAERQARDGTDGHDARYEAAYAAHQARCNHSISERSGGPRAMRGPFALVFADLDGSLAGSWIKSSML